ncbi:MAG: hypothetical protein HUU46_18455 [Candidatus Hydrogenedentes bacterium]|nr:hypothetical protein [Candidatus Hydrogenedentota bacterium]
MRWLSLLLVCASALAAEITTAARSDLLGAAPPLDNVVPPLDASDHMTRDPRSSQPWQFPIVVPPFEEHVRGESIPNPRNTAVSSLAINNSGGLVASYADEAGVATSYDLMASGWVARTDKTTRMLIAQTGNTVWTVGNALNGLAHGQTGVKSEKWPYYGVNGPLSTTITGLAVDSRGTLWVGTPVGLSKRNADGTWVAIRGRDGLPYEDITCLTLDKSDRLWIGTSMGVVHYRPYEEGRQWFYRQGKRYLPDDNVTAIAVSPDGKRVYAGTSAGIGAIEVRTTTLLERAHTIEKLVNQRHRRYDLVAECVLNDALNPTSHTIGDNDNDGLWTAYHVAAMSLAYGATKNPAAMESAKRGMHALYMLQNASGIPGLVARSVLPPEEGSKRDADRPENRRQWRPTPDGKMYWKSDTSSDEIDGHFLAFFAYFEHVARHDAAEKALCVEQCRKLIDYLIANNYRLIDWNGERTRWGFWNPENLNGEPRDYAEHGLNALQMLSFLRTSYHVIGDQKYLDHYKTLILDHHYLSNVLLSKKEWPDENNHSDDQLGYVAWYPILQLEKDPVILNALTQGVRRHYRIVWPEKPSFYAFVTATVDPQQVEMMEAIQNLIEIPTDRRTWEQKNSRRADVDFLGRSNRFGDPVLTRVLPADERCFQKWNGDPYEPDRGGDGRSEDDGAAFLLPYWMGRYHGFIAESQ